MESVTPLGTSSLYRVLRLTGGLSERVDVGFHSVTSLASANQSARLFVSRHVTRPGSHFLNKERLDDSPNMDAKPGVNKDTSHTKLFPSS